MRFESLLSKDDSERSNQLENLISNSPMRVFGHALQLTNKSRCESLRANYFGNLFEPVQNIEDHLRVVVFDKLHEDWDDLLLGCISADNRRHVTECNGDPSLKLRGSVCVSVGQGGEHQVTDLVSRQVVQTVRDVLDRCILNLSFVVVQKNRECLHEVIVCDFFSE